MELKKVTRVKFPTKADFESWKESETIDEVFNPSIITIVELGTVKLPDTFDEEGNRIEGETIEGYHVDFINNIYNE